MAFLFQRPNSSKWWAGWRGVDGKRANRSTGIPVVPVETEEPEEGAKPKKKETKANLRKRAQNVANGFEEVALNLKAARHVRETIAGLHREITGSELASATLRESVTAFLQVKEGESAPATLSFYKRATGDFVDWLGERADEDIANIRSSDIAGFRNHLLKKVTDITTTNKIKALRALFAAAHRQGLVLEEPTTALKLSRKGGGDGQSEKRPFTLEELKQIRGEASGEWQSMIMFGLYTGQRLGDLATLRWNSLDTVKGLLRITTRKTKRQVNIPLAQPLLDHIGSLEVGGSEFVHPGLAAVYESKGSSTLSNQFNKILADCGLREAVSHKSKKKGRDVKREKTTVSFHSLRSTAVTMLHEAGIPAATVEEWVGHDSAEVHRTYIKLGEGAMRKASDALPEI